jgi:crotonobetainyl-CoA:carnitine CoA-transferase CaiB-like acyl-CoA transferase
MSRSWALTHRNERSLGIDLRHPDGAAVFRGLVAAADAVFANFKPGTLDALGLSFDELRALNPNVVLAESSAFGADGPWSGRMGYGPLVRATTGVSRLWSDRTPGADGGAFLDATTIFPDHVAAKITAVAALAALIGRRDGATRVHVSQAEVAINQLAAAYVVDAARASGAPLDDDAAVHAVLPCAGDDEWCVVSVTSDEHRRALQGVVGTPDSGGDLVEAFVTGLAVWTASRDKADVARMLQEAGVPAGPMYRAADVLADAQLGARATFTDMTHPLFPAPMPTETRPARYRHLPDADLRPAPMPGEHTRAICADVLAMPAGEIDELIAAGALFDWTRPGADPDPRIGSAE